MNNSREKISFWSVNLCIVAALLFFCRTITPAYKYLFLALFVPSACIYAYFLFKNRKAINVKKLTLPVLVFVLFVVHFSANSLVVKSIVNTLYILLMLVPVAWSIKKAEVQKRVVYLFAVLVEVVAVLAILRKVFGILNWNMPLSTIIAEPRSYFFSLVHDYNFFSLYFLILIICSVWLYAKKYISVWHFCIMNILSIVSTIASTSRRTYMLFLILLFVGAGLLLLKSNSKYTQAIKKLYKAYAVIFSLLLIFAFVFKNQICYRIIISEQNMRTAFKVVNLFAPSKTFDEFSSERWATVGSENLFYNGDFRHGDKYWEPSQSSKIKVEKKLLTENGDTFIRLNKIKGKGYFSLMYMGHPITYKKGVTYTIEFKYRVVKGDSTPPPFHAGWYAYDAGKYRHYLPKQITPFDSVWNICKVSYTFDSTFYNARGFLNGQKEGTIIDVKDIRLTHNDTVSPPDFVYQKPVQEADTAKNTSFTNSRTSRWWYAYELWQTRYSAVQKIFGRGFDYIEWYGERFHNNSKRYDFPHNPIISAFLYSGVVGAVVYVLFLVASFVLYWRQRKQIGLFMIIYLCCFFFSFFSGNSHFSFPLFVFLSFLPFATNCQKENFIK